MILILAPLIFIYYRMVSLTVDEYTMIRERSCKTLAILARLAAGRDAITGNKNLLDNICICVEDVSVEVRIQVAALLEMLSKSWRGKELLNISFTPQ